MGHSLDGLLVVALEQAVAAPFCTQRMVEAGARVIKIERREGDFARRYENTVSGESAYFVWLNRGKESVVLDIKDRGDVELLRRVIRRADVFVQNLAPGVAESHGIGSDRLRDESPRLITCDISGYGSRGPRAGAKAYDLLVQAESGLSSVTGRAEGPGRVGISICDVAAGMYSYVAILEALHERRTTGHGRSISISLFDAMADWMTVPMLLQASGGIDPPRLGLRHPSIAPYGAYATADGELVLAVQNEREWARLCDEVLAQPEMSDDPRFFSNQARVANREQLDAAVSRVLGGLSTSDALALLDAAGIASATVSTVGQVWHHPQLRRGTAKTVDGSEVAMPVPALLEDSGEVPDLGSVPGLDEHGAAIRQEFA